MPVPDWVDEVPLDPGPPHVRMGTRRIDVGDWLLVDGRRADELALKAELLARRRREVVAVDPSRPSGEAQAETLALVTAWLADHGVGREPPGFEAADPGPTPAAHRAPDLERAARLVQEDLCLMAMDDGPPVLVAAVLCFPSHWRLADKIGRPMAAIHAPVPDYASTLGDRPDRLLDGLTPGRIVARRNWSVHEGDALFAPDRLPPSTMTPAEVPRRLTLRSERQTLRRLESGPVLFTIRVQQCPMGDLATRPDLRARLAAAARAEAPERLDRIAGGQVDPLLAWLDA